MTAPVPLAIDDLLHAVVEACVEEIAAARHELATELAAAAEERRYLEARKDELVADLVAARETIAAKDTELRNVKAELVAALSLMEGLAPATRKGLAPAASLPLSPPRIAETKSAVFKRRVPRIDLTGQAIGTFVGVEPTEERRVGAVVWIFRCTLCGEVRRWTSNNLNALRKKSGSSFRCVCQGGSKGSATGRSYRGPGAPVRHIPVERTEPTQDFIDERLDELDTSIGAGDEVDDLLSRALREADGDSRLRSIGERAMRPTRPSDLEDGEEPTDNPERDPDEEDADEDSAEELDFG